MPKSSPHPHVVWRDGRPRFSPGSELRDNGFAGTDLRWPLDAPAGWRPVTLKPGDRNQGRWFSRGETVDWSDAFVAALQVKRDEQQKRERLQPKPPKKMPSYTVAAMFEDWWRSPKFVRPRPQGYSPASILDYKQKARIIETDHPLIWNAPAAWLERPTLRAMFEEIWIGRQADKKQGINAMEARGLASARGALLTLSACYTWAILKGKVRLAVNPCHKLMMQKPAPRIRFATRPEIEALVKAADLTGRPEDGDMILLAVWTGQRQGDRVEFLHKGKLNGRRHFRQNKTGAIVAIMGAPELENRINASIERRRAAKAKALLVGGSSARERTEKLFAHVVLDETRWLPFSGDHWSRRFAELRNIVVAGIKAEGWTEAAPVWKLAPVPSVSDLWDLDFRDTAVTWMALAGATIAEIIAVTGHQLESATEVLKHYLARHPEMADSAIAKMVSWYEGGGETEIGL